MDSYLTDKRRFSRNDVAALLRGRKAFSELSQDEALAVVTCMKPVRIKEGAVLTQQGSSSSNQMMLILQGEAAVETETDNANEPLLVTLLGPGDLIGELGMFDGEPRSATCTAASEMYAALMGQEHLEKLMAEKPAVSAKLLSVILQRVSQKLRVTTEKLRKISAINESLTSEMGSLEQKLHAALSRPAAAPPEPATFQPTVQMAPQAVAFQPTVQRNPRQAAAAAARGPAEFAPTRPMTLADLDRMHPTGRPAKAPSPAAADSPEYAATEPMSLDLLAAMSRPTPPRQKPAHPESGDLLPPLVTSRRGR
jgi:CRP-like cAMP-binding protein